MTIEEWLGEDNEIGLKIFKNKYQYKNETFDEWLDRVSGGDVALKQLIIDKKGLPGGRTLANRGIKNNGSNSNCYSMGYAPDDYEGLLNTNTQIGLTYKAQGGQGVSLSKLRPKGTPIGENFTSDGVIGFARIFNTTTKETSQGGARKGALMISLDVNHKDAEEFITIKSDKSELTKANLSLEIDDKFMEAVDKYYATGEVVTYKERRSYSGHDVEYEVTPINLYKKLCAMSHASGEPGVLFVDELRNYNLMQYVDDYEIETTNACGEQPLPKHGSCNLFSLNLSKFVENPFTAGAKFNYEDFFHTVSIAVSALDDILDDNIDKHPLQEQRKCAQDYRNIGLGVFGYASMLIKMGLKFGSDEAIRFTNKLFSRLFNYSLKASCALAESRGTFPKCDYRILESDIIKNHTLVGNRDKGTYPLPRNCSLVSIAPTGTIATMLNETGGCEPLFALKTRRKTESLEGDEAYFDIDCEVLKEYKACNDSDKIDITDCLVTAYDIPWEDRIKTLSVIQSHVDTGVSSTINLPKDIPVEEIEKLYLAAWEGKLKGVTIYRDGSRDKQVLSTSKNDENTSLDTNTQEENFTTKKEGFNSIKPVTREQLGNRLDGAVYAREVACGKLYIIISHNENGDLVETFVDGAKSGGCAANTECIGRLCSLSLRAGVDINYIIDSIKGIKCGACQQVKGNKSKHIDGLSCGDVIAKAIEQEYKFLHEKQPEVDTKYFTANRDITLNHDDTRCPDCGEPLRHEGGCVVCSCGYSKCN